MHGRSDTSPNPAVRLGHQPHCEAATTEMLQPLVVSRFPADSDGITRIPYTMFGQRRFHLGTISEVGIKLRLSSLPMPSDQADFMTKIITDALAVWTKMSNNKVIFYPHDPILETRGLRFNLAPMLELDHMGAYALTILATDNSGYMRFSDVYYPEGGRFWNSLKNGDYMSHFNLKTIHHEIGHALGLSTDWPENSAAMQALRNTPDGVFCSVMPYDHYVTSGTSSCKSDCDPAFAITPGPTDEAMFKLAYESGNFPQCLGINSESAAMLWLTYLHNAMNNAVISSCTAATNGFVVSFGKHLAFTAADVPSIPATAVHIVADAGMLAAMIFTEIPIYECAVFGVTAATKYIPESALDRLPVRAKDILTSNYSIYVVNLVQGLRKGHCVIPLIATSAITLTVTWAATGLGEGLGELAANGVSYVVRKIRSVFHRPTAAPQVTEVDIEAQHLAPEQVEQAPETAPAPAAAPPAAEQQPGWFARMFSYCRRSATVNAEPAAQPGPLNIV